tara:strand:- start:970 stop:1329 length:360 start_codon:yes stop_codon:yes gene_type:complete
MTSSDIFNLTIKTYETKLEHGKTSLKKIFNKPDDIETIDGSINLQNIDELLNNCINCEQKISFLREYKNILIKSDTKNSSDIEEIKEPKNIKLEKKNKKDDDIEIIEKPCNCRCNMKSN